MEVMDAIYHRRATRDFTDAPVAKTLISSLVSAAIQAPNAMDLQRWAFVVVQDRALLERVSSKAKAHMLATMEPDSVVAPLRAHLSAPNFNIFYNAPIVIVICATESDTFAYQDCCLAAENLMLAAYANGLGTCWIGFAEAWLNQPEGKTALGIPAHYRPIAPIIVGYPRATPPAPPRHQPDIIWIEP